MGKITIKPENVIYQGTFSDVAAGQQLAASMYDKGVKVVFAAAGGVVSEIDPSAGLSCIPLHPLDGGRK